MTYPENRPVSKALHDRAKRVMPGGNTRTTVYIDPFPLYGARGAGCRVYDVDGNEMIDCINNFTAMIHGYANDHVNQAVSRQLPLGTAFGMPTASELDLAELLVGRLPGVEHIRFANSGTEAVMMALKAARAFTGRHKIAKVEGAYHGSYDYAEVSLDSNPSNWGDGKPASVPYAKGTPPSVLDDVVVLPMNDLEAAAAIFAEHGSELAGVLIDPMPNRAGLIPADRDYLEEIQRLCRASGALVIFDEVIAFRLGFGGAQSIWGITPDLTALGKIIGGGFPIGAIGGSAEVMSVFDPSKGKPALPHGGTFSANPISMVAGHAAMEILDQATFARLDAQGDHVRREIGARFKRRGLPGQVTGLGSLFKLHFTDDPIRDYRSGFPDATARRRLDVMHKALLNNGILAAGYGLFALSTPMTDADIDLIVDRSDAALAAVAAI
ncbi:MAG: class III aminotransferase [Pelagibacterium sp. SCN 64-44]|nr:MAG: class III aminotransferase [Pelagibacterium sp. SCN 64-44]